MADNISVHPREGGDPVLWATNLPKKARLLIPRTAPLAQIWVPAFAGCTDETARKPYIHQRIVRIRQRFQRPTLTRALLSITL